jgi:hypothetical protein
LKVAKPSSLYYLSLSLLTPLKPTIKLEPPTETQPTLAETTQKLNESNHKLELSAKENSENEKVLEQLLKEMQELEKEL